MTPPVVHGLRALTLVTTVRDAEPLKWGLEVRRIALPTVLLCTGDMARVLGELGVPPHVRIVPMEFPERPSARDKLAALQRVCAAGLQPADLCYWMDADLLYAKISFEFFYSDILTRAINRFAPDRRAHFEMPGHRRDAFFGGPKQLLIERYEPRDDDAADWFEPAPAAAGPLRSFPRALTTPQGMDLNLSLATVIDAPIVHVIGDSHVLSGFTPGNAIGSRPNVLLRTRDASARPVPYAYQFTHYLGGRTMHHAGRPGALIADADQCGVKRGDAVVWVFGEIDARSHILRRPQLDGRTVDEVVDTLARDFIAAVLEVKRRFETALNVVFAPIPPLDNPAYTSESLPAFGSIDERVAVTRQLRAALKTLCERHGFVFLDRSPEFETPRGDLRWELSDRFCHVHVAAQGPIVEALYRALAGDAGAD